MKNIPLYSRGLVNTLVTSAFAQRSDNDSRVAGIHKGKDKYSSILTACGEHVPFGSDIYDVYIRTFFQK